MVGSIPIRAISRAIAVLTAINRDGSTTMMEISKASEIPYATAFRIVQTLLHEGLIESEPARKRYRTTSLVQSLSMGFQEEDELVVAARSHIEKLCHKIGWPLSLATRVGTRMVVRDSTHKLTSLTFTNYYPGFSMPIAECATGKAYLAFCDADERDVVAEGWRTMSNDISSVGLLLVGDDAVLSRIRTEGYAQQIRTVHNAEPGRTSSIAVPVLDANDRLIGSLAITYFDSALKPIDAVREFLAPLKNTAWLIQKDIKKLAASAHAVGSGRQPDSH